MMDTDIKKLYGVGAARAAAYGRLGIHTVEDLLVHYPRGYEDRGNVRLLSEADGIGKSAHLLTVATEPKSARIRGRMSLLKFRAYDDSGICEITFFNQDFLRNVFAPGATFRFYGRVERKNGKYAMTSPAYEPWREDIELPPLIPVYPLTEGLSQKQIAKDMKSALTLLSLQGEEDMLPSELRRRQGLCLRSYAIRNIHAPESFSALAAAKKRLIFEEFFLFSLGISATAKRREITEADPCPKGDYQSLCDRLPYELTDAQKRVAHQIRSDMAKGQAMNRILIGDVGSGKTVCAAIAMWIALQNGKQAALMAPTEILARQHYADLCDLFIPMGIQPVLLCGSLSAAEKKKIHRGLSASDPAERISLVVGTQALLSEGVEFAEPGVVVADEQHRFGVNQRATLAEKNRHSHMLVMSATPIPRTLALSLYGDLDVSLLDEMPKGRQRVDTFVVDESYRTRLQAFILKQVEASGQVYVVCPSIEENEEEETDLSLSDIDGEGKIRKSTPLKSAVGYAEELSAA
ncbi:MAG: DEAD/DEAH box helicase, partial [Clostridia bacterium]|nr:DEAD/DEAH box helicase [Clostridia bacterium]